MSRVEATTRHSDRDLGSVEMWLSGLRRAPAKGLGESLARSNRVISSNLSITGISSSAERRVWDADARGSIPRSRTTWNDGEAGAHVPLKRVRSWFDSSSFQLCPSTLVVKGSTDNRDSVGRNHGWVPFIGGLKAVFQAVCKTVAIRHWWSDSTTTDHFYIKYAMSIANMLWRVGVTVAHRALNSMDMVRFHDSLNMRSWPSGPGIKLQP